VPICNPKVICPAIFWVFDIDFRRCRTATSNEDIGKGEKAGRLGTHIFGGENGSFLANMAVLLALDLHAIYCTYLA